MMLQKWEEGYEVVYTKRLSTKGVSRTKRATSRLFYKGLNRVSDVEIENGTADFRLIDRKVADVLSNMNEYELFFRGMVKWVGFKQFALEYEAEERFAGKSKYNLRRMFSFAVQGVTAFSTRPLYAATYLGIFFSCLSLLYIPYIIYSQLSGHAVSGWTSLIVTVVFFGGLQLLLIGVVGIYIGKIFMQVKQRPHYIVNETSLHEPAHHTVRIRH
jgi:polyisoprenyl-phosphate glycosyltransferase